MCSILAARTAELLPADADRSDVGKQTDSDACGRPAPSTPMIGLFAAIRPSSRGRRPLLEARSPRRVACFVTSGAARSSLLTPPTDPRRLPHSHTRCRVHFSAPFPPFPVSCLAASSISSFAVPARRKESVNRVRAPLFDCFHCTNARRGSFFRVKDRLAKYGLPRARFVDYFLPIFPHFACHAVVVVFRN